MMHLMHDLSGLPIAPKPCEQSTSASRTQLLGVLPLTTNPPLQATWVRALRPPVKG